MSSILKALEKAEESSSTRRMGGDSGLIRSRRSRPVWVMPVAVLCGAGVATLATFAAMGGFSRPAAIAQAPVVVAKSAPVVVAPLNPVIETPEVVPEQAQPIDPALLVPSPKTAAVVPQKAAHGTTLRAAPPLNSKATPPAGKLRAAAVSPSQPAFLQPAALQMAPVQPAAAPAVAPAPARPELKVSGIAWQNNGESSFAVVNGRAVLQGGSVDGFKVLEIRQDTVRFSGSNGTFEVPLGGDEK